MRRATLLALGAAAVLGLGAAGLVTAQEQPEAPPSEVAPPPPYVVGPPVGDAPANATGDSLTASAPPDEAAPPPPLPVHAPAAVPANVAEASGPPLPPPPPPPPPVRPRFQVAVLQAVDKVTAETLRFEARVGESVRYKGLVVTVRACEEAAVDELRPETMGYLQIDSQPAPVPGRPTIAARQVYSGWMTAGSPGLNPLQSPGYDVWMIACNTPAPPPPGQA